MNATQKASRAAVAAIAGLVLGFSGVRAASAEEVARTEGPRVVRQQEGVASWYGPGFHGRLTANGERFDF